MAKSDEDRLLDHSYDGIQEYDNPLPRWWLWIFYATILWSADDLAHAMSWGIELLDTYGYAWMPDPDAGEVDGWG